MRISAKADYAVRAAVTLAAAEPGTDIPAEAIARGQEIPYKFLEAILTDLRRDRIVTSSRGARGGDPQSRPGRGGTGAGGIPGGGRPLAWGAGGGPPIPSYVGA